ncbi:hypothetical protein HY478_02850 [Candidatus Uhrbacteria bacterium]|nr:hypothetical protein [Candidatus Uhrbacteria bacterium]
MVCFIHKEEAMRSFVSIHVFGTDQGRFLDDSKAIDPEGGECHLMCTTRVPTGLRRAMKTGGVCSTILTV